jgi:NADH dehydrogenase
MPSRSKNIVILGAGFAGLQVAQTLPDLISEQHKITLVDRNSAHFYTPDIYEISTAYNDDVSEECLTKLKESVATPIESLIDSDRVEFIQREVTGIDSKKRTVKLKGHRTLLNYDYLVVALGSVPHFFGIPGLDQYAQTLKTVYDALGINCHLDQLFQKAKKGQRIDLVIGGGGATGTELTAELAGYVQKLCIKYKFPRKKVSITLVEGGARLAGMGVRGTHKIQQRFKQRGITTELDHFITKVTSQSVTLKSVQGKVKRIPYTYLIWTGGVKVHPLVTQALGDPKFRGGIVVDRFLRSKAHPRVFAAGDNIYFTPIRSKRPLAMLAQYAFRQGKVLAHNLAAVINKKSLKPYKPHPSIYIIPIGGKFALVRIWRFIFSGYFPWLMHRLVSLNYAASIMPIWRAWKKWRHGEDIFERNDI